MNRLLLLRPVSRAIRAEGAVQCSRNLSRLFSTTPCRNLRATIPVTKKSQKNGMGVVDADFFDGGLEGQIEQESPVPPAQKFRSSVVHSAKQNAHNTPKPNPTIPTPNKDESTGDVLEGESTLAPRTPISNKPVDIEEYYGSWFSHETRVALAEHHLDRYAFVSAILETPYCQSIIDNFDPETENEFEKRWLAFEISEKDDDRGLIPVLEFFLRGGLQLLPPTPNAMDAQDHLRFVEPSVAQKSLDSAPKGPWQTKGRQVKNYITEPINFPNLMTPDRILDPRDVIDFPPDKQNAFANQVIVRNHRSVFHQYPEGAKDDLLEDEGRRPVEEEEGGDSVANSLQVTDEYYQGLYQSILMRRSVIQQTGKGKIRRIAYMVLVGDGKGLVGYGEGKHANPAVALKAARVSAVRNMDWVERFEQRTIWTEMKSKLGATQLILRPRPVGFGLRCNPFLHQILRAAGMKDISAKVWGSRNKLNVIKAAFRMLHAGHAPTGMGDGVGGKGKKLSKGRGVRGKAELERARGRKLISLRN